MISIEGHSDLERLKTNVEYLSAPRRLLMDNTVELRWVVSVIRRWLWLIVGCVLLAATSAFVVSSRMPPVYSASATLLVHVAPGTDRAPIDNGIGCIQEGEPVNSGAYEGRYLATAACVPTCPADIDDDGRVGVLDFLRLLAAWGTDPGGPPDLDGDGVVGLGDFAVLLDAWGDCP